MLKSYGRLRAIMDETKKSKRGFASLSPEKRREIASKGGKSVPAERRSFALYPELAAEAGRKGGKSVSSASRSFSRDRSLASEAGRKGRWVSQRRSQDRES